MPPKSKAKQPAKKTTRKSDDDEKPKREIKIWRADGTIDRSKRAGKIPAEVDPSNVLPTGRTRARRDFNYNDGMALRNMDVETVETGSVLRLPERDSVRKSKNVYDKRTKAIEAKDKENKKTTPRKEKKTTPRKRSKKEVEESTEEKSADDKVETSEPEQKEPEEKPATKAKTTLRSRRSTGGKKAAECALSDAAVKQLQRLGGTVPTGKLVPRKYNNHKDDIPAAIQTFLDTKFPEGTRFKNKTGIAQLEILEFALTPEETKDTKFLNDYDDAILIGDAGQMIVAARESDTSDDFTVYLLGDEGDIESKMALSKFLADLEIDPSPKDS